MSSPFTLPLQMGSRSNRKLGESQRSACTTGRTMEASSALRFGPESLSPSPNTAMMTLQAARLSAARMSDQRMSAQHRRSSGVHSFCEQVNILAVNQGVHLARYGDLSDLGELAATDVWNTRKPRNTMMIRPHLSPEPAGRNIEKRPMIDMMITGTIMLNL